MNKNTAEQPHRNDKHIHNTPIILTITNNIMPTRSNDETNGAEQLGGAIAIKYSNANSKT